MGNRFQLRLCYTDAFDSTLNEFGDHLSALFTTRILSQFARRSLVD